MTAQVSELRQVGIIQKAAALAQQKPQQIHEAGPVADTEKLLNIMGVKAVHPLCKEGRILVGREQRCRQTAMKKPTVKVLYVKISNTFTPECRWQIDSLFLAARSLMTGLYHGGQIRQDRDIKASA